MLKRTFTDISLDFDAHPVTGDISVLKDKEAIKKSIKNIVLTDYYEKPFQPNFGSEVRKSLFSLINPMTEKTIQVSISDAINNFEKRVNLISVDVKVMPDENGYSVAITFAIDDISEIVKVDLFLERIR